MRLKAEKLNWLALIFLLSATLITTGCDGGGSSDKIVKPDSPEENGGTEPPG